MRHRCHACRESEAISERVGERGTLPSAGRPDTADKVTARLKRDDPKLAQRVVNGEITPNAAARAKGWRKPRIVLSAPASVAKALRKHMEPDDLAELIC